MGGAADGRCHWSSVVGEAGGRWGRVGEWRSMNPPVRISGGRGGKVGSAVGRGCGGDGGQGMGWSDGSRQTKREMLQRKTKRRSHKGRGRNSCTATVIDVQALIKGAAVFMVLKRVRWSHGGRERTHEQLLGMREC